MSRFLSTQNHRHSLGNNPEFDKEEWVDFAGGLPYHVIDRVVSNFNEKEAMKANVELLKSAIVGWCFYTDDGSAVPFSSEKVEELNSKTIIELGEIAMKLYLPSKKN